MNVDAGVPPASPVGCSLRLFRVVRSSTALHQHMPRGIRFRDGSARQRGHHAGRKELPREVVTRYRAQIGPNATRTRVESARTRRRRVGVWTLQHYTGEPAGLAGRPLRRYLREPVDDCLPTLGQGVGVDRQQHLWTVAEDVTDRAEFADVFGVVDHVRRRGMTQTVRREPEESRPSPRAEPASGRTCGGGRVDRGVSR